MNKKEISEIKKLLNKDKCHITRLCGCYVDAEKNIKTTIKQAFHSLEDEEMFKYINIFRGSLSGTIGKNLINLEFPNEQEAEGGTQHFLMQLKESRLRDDGLIQEFYNRVIENYEYGENYYIILAHAAYDIPTITSDNVEQEDASIYVYEHLLCSICPVKLEKSGLCYNAEANTIETRIRGWLVDAPAHGFLFPAFNDRNTDIHAMLYYTKKSEEPNPSFMDNMFACHKPLTSKNQNETFQSIITNSLGDECCFETVKNIHENINEMIEVQKDMPEPVIFDKSDVKQLFADSGISNEKLELFDKNYEHTMYENTDVEENEIDKTSFVANNITNSRNLEIKMPDVSIKVSPDKSHLVETRIIDGIPYITVQVDGVIELNGVAVRPDAAETE